MGVGFDPNLKNLKTVGRMPPNMSMTLLLLNFFSLSLVSREWSSGFRWVPTDLCPLYQGPRGHWKGQDGRILLQEPHAKGGGGRGGRWRGGGTLHRVPTLTITITIRLRGHFPLGVKVRGERTKRQKEWKPWLLLLSRQSTNKPKLQTEFFTLNRLELKLIWILRRRVNVVQLSK